MFLQGARPAPWGDHVIVEGNGNDILIDGSATVVNPGDSLYQILTDWKASASTAVNQRLKLGSSGDNILVRREP